MSTPSIESKPVIFLGHEEYLRLSERYIVTGGNPDQDTFEPVKFPLANWLRLLSSAQYRVAGLLNDPLNPAMLDNIVKTNRELSDQELGVTDQLPLMPNKDEIWNSLMDDEVVSVDGVPYNILRSFMNNIPHLPPLFLRIIFNPTSGDWRADCRLCMGYCVEPEDIAAQMVQSGTWTYSALRGFDSAIGEAIQHPRISEWIEAGARILVVAGRNPLLARPVLLPMRRTGNVTEFWKPRSPGAVPEGSPAALIHSSGLNERLNLRQIMKRIDRAVELARAAGKKPLFVYDIDGTVANAREFTRLVFEEFLDMYQRLAKNKPSDLTGLIQKTRGLKADDMKTALIASGITDKEMRGLAQGHWDFRKRESSTNAYDAVQALREFLDAYAAINSKTALRLKTAYEALKQMQEPSAWNNVEMLKQLEITDPFVALLASAHFERNFFSSVRRLDKKPIKGTVQLIRYLQSKYPDLIAVSLTLRDAHDDNLPDGRSSSKVWFAKIGMWTDQSILLRLEERHYINFTAEAFKAGGNEPSKGDLLQGFLSKHPDVHPIMILENDPKHTNGYQDLFPHEVIVVRVDAKDSPPYSPPDTNGVFIFRADQLEEALQSTLSPAVISSLNERAITFEGDAWEPMMLRWHAAVAAGIQPVAVLDIDDTLLLTAKRARIVLQKFLEEIWIPEHPEHSWAAEVVGEFTPSQVEYGVPATLKAAGLDGLGLEFERAFKPYFLERFLSNEFLGEDPVRPGALGLVGKLHAIGTRIIYLTGRTKDDMGEGTVAALVRAGFPLDDASATLVMREDHDEPDSVFKARVLKEQVGDGALIAIFDNEPQNLIDAGRLSPGTSLYLVGDKHSPEAPEPPIEAVTIGDFLGEIGPQPPRMRPVVGQELRDNGAKAADELIDTLTRMFSDHQLMYGFGADYKDRIEVTMTANALHAGAIMSQMMGLHRSHPTARAFIGRINEKLRAMPGGLPHFEELLHLADWRTKNWITALWGRQGIELLVDAEKGVPPAYLPEPLPSAYLASNGGGVSIRDAIPLASIKGRLLKIPKGPAINGAGPAELFDALSFGSYPRMHEVLRSIVADIAVSRGVTPNGLLAVEYGPRRAIAAMAYLGRMGVNVGYREPVITHRLHTEVELQRLPKEVAAGIRHIPSEEKAQADIAIWNLPTAAVEVSDLIEDMQPSNNPTLIVQSDRSTGERLANDAAAHGLTRVVKITLPRNQYVMPSAFLHTVRPASPLMFQIFRFMPI